MGPQPGPGYAGVTVKIWECKIGEVDDGDVPIGGDFPMREAVGEAYRSVTGHEPRFVFSGWAGELTDSERAVVEDREPPWPTPPIRPETVVEHAVLMSGGGMHVRYEDPEIERIYPLAQWIEHGHRFGGRVYRRTVIVVEDWEEVSPRITTS